MKIYTKTGDLGQTSLANGQRVSKSEAHIEAYGTADELNAFVGLLRSRLSGADESDRQLEWIQNKLFNLSAALAKASGEWIMMEDVQQLEQWTDAMQMDLPAFRGFVLPGGSETISLSHICRTVTRRLERQMVRLEEADSEAEKLAIFICFINRLSDFWFIFAQKCAKNEGVSAIFWKK